MSEATYIHGTEPSEQRRLAALNQLINASFLAFMDFTQASAVLEVGSGMGLLTRDVALRLPHAELVGIEYSEKQLAQADHTVANLRFVQGDAHELEFEDDRFDVVYCRCLLECIYDPLRVLQEMYRVTRPGGRVFVQENDTSAQHFDPPVPEFESVWAQVPVLQQTLGGDSLIGRRLFALLKQSGLRDVRISMGNDVYWSGSPGFAVWIGNTGAILEGCAAELVAHGLATQEQVRRALVALRRFSDQEDASSWFYWNRAAGQKPVRDSSQSGLSSSCGQQEA